MESFKEQKFGDNHKVKLGRKRSKTNDVELGEMASGLWVSPGAPGALRRLFKRAVGSPQALSNEATARGQKYLHGTKTNAFVSG